MNNKEFLESLSAKWGRSQEDTAALASRVVSIMSEELQEGNAVCIQDFGTFEVKKKMERVCVIPSTGQRVLVPPKLVLVFKPAAALKEQMK